MLDFGPRIATFWAACIIPPHPASFPLRNGPKFPGNRRGSASFGAGAARLWRALLQSDGATWRHGIITGRQDRVHHRADPRPHPRRPLPGVRTVRDRADRAGPSRAAAGRCGAALWLRNPRPHPDRGTTLAELDDRYQRITIGH